MEFKYFENYEALAFINETEIACAMCGLITRCFEPVRLGTDGLAHICAKCLFEKKLYGWNTFLNNGNYKELFSQVKEVYKDMPEAQQHELAKERTKELEQATPQLVTWQDMDWPCLDGDYAKFIGYGSKALFNKLAGNTHGVQLYKASLHADLLQYYSTEQWNEMLPNELIATAVESGYCSPLVYVFKSLKTEKIVTWWDCI